MHLVQFDVYEHSAVFGQVNVVNHIHVLFDHRWYSLLFRIKSLKNNDSLSPCLWLNKKVSYIGILPAGWSCWLLLTLSSIQIALDWLCGLFSLPRDAGKTSALCQLPAYLHKCPEPYLLYLHWYFYLPQSFQAWFLVPISSPASILAVCTMFTISPFETAKNWKHLKAINKENFK
jgi:hypothetical protein